MSASTKYIEKWTVIDEDLDELDHVNNLQYLRWTLKVAASHSSHVGWPSSRYRQLGMGWVVRSHKITYKIPAKLNDAIEIRTWVESLTRSHPCASTRSCLSRMDAFVLKLKRAGCL